MESYSAMFLVPGKLGKLTPRLFRLSAELLRPGGGRLVVINPLRAEPPDAATRRRLRLASQRTVDLGLRRACSVEVWERTGEE